MGLKPRYIEYFTYNINSYSELLTLKEELKKLLDNRSSISLQISAYGYNDQEYSFISQPPQTEETKPSVSFFDSSYSSLDYSPTINGAGAKQNN